MTLQYPPTSRGDVVDVLHGQRISDPYRWLEDPDSDQTRAWVQSQVEFTEGYLSGLPDREWFRRTARGYVLQDFAAEPQYLHGYYVQARVFTDKPQPVMYFARTLAELEAGEGSVLVDPNAFSEDGTSALGALTISRDGRLLAYGRSDAGSDWNRIYVVDIASGEVVDESVVTKFCAPEFTPDGKAFFYTAYDETGRTDGVDTSSLPLGHVALHRVGADVDTDRRIWTNPGDPMILPGVKVSVEGDRLILQQYYGTERFNKVWVYPLESGADGVSFGEPVRFVDEFVDDVRPIRFLGEDLLVLTDRDAPLMKLARLSASGQMVDVVAEGECPIEDVCAAGDGVLVSRLVDAAPRISSYDLDGSFRGELAFEAGAVFGLHGEQGRDEFFLGASSVSERYVSFVGSFASGSLRMLNFGGSQQMGQVRLERRRAPSSDGTLVPYFLLSRADLPLDGPRPTLLYGYGGFNVPVAANFSPGFATWLAAGGVVAIANLRGGGEFGKKWYDQGRRECKQNVFDDAIGVAEHLIESGVTTSAQLALHGRSNGGLLVGAVITQRPDLFAVGLPGVGVLDMLRFHLFSGGRFWISDYGDPEVAADFDVALAYSPLHNIREGVQYPAVLVTTGDHDDRVVPLHSHKFTAALQRAQAGSAPILTRIEVNTGHGAGKPRSMVADEWADMLTFAAAHTGLRPGEHPEAR